MIMSRFPKGPARTAISDLHPPYLTTLSGPAGHRAILMHWNPANEDYAPYVTGPHAHGELARAAAEAREWAKEEGLQYREPEKLSKTALNPKAAWPFPEPK
jgi:hypothetical protein